MYKVNKVQSKTGERDSGNYFVRGPITALTGFVRLRCLDGVIKNIGCARRAMERVSDRVSVDKEGSPYLHTALYGGL